MPIPSKQLISFPWEINRIEEVVYLLGFSSAALFAWQTEFSLFNSINPLLLFLIYFSTFGLWVAACRSLLFILSVAVGPVLTSLLRTFGPNTAGGSLAQHCKKGPLQV